ncbi:hypothetical protein [Olleya sp. 1-3]|uniref:hypothetical protein n=1 Tax=Olleya sp. 1-3 TaxID=2058323 RepID=UPI000C31BE92|nr:hypothetical protein [Olleya sp. 1-3]PKG52893.1 hypothetical protein CXF54_03705 [Olleya sp. 1-3]
MKNTTQNIINWFNSETTENQLNLLRENSPKYEQYETTVLEALDELDFVKQLIVSSVEKDVFEKITYNKRNQIFANLNNITNYLNQLSRWNYDSNNNQAKSQVNAIITTILGLRDIVDSSFLSQKLKGYYNYAEQTKELNKIKRRYNNLVKDISNAEVLNRKTIGVSKTINEKADVLINKITELEKTSASTLNLKNQIENLYNQINSNLQEIETKKLTINSLHQNSENIESTFETIETKLKETLENSETRAEDFLLQKETEFNTKTDGFDLKTSNIITKNTELQKKVNSLLEGANAGRLYKSFHWRKRQLEKGLWFWLSGIAIINISLVILTLLILNGNDIIGIDKLDSTNLNGMFYMKLLISIPLIVLDFFFIKQYNSRRDLIEKYSFKSVLSLSILAYNEMLKENKDDDVSQQFIIETVERIYESPFETKKLTKKELDIVNSLAKKGLDHLDKVTNGAIKSAIGE